MLFFCCSHYDVTDILSVTGHMVSQYVNSHISTQHRASVLLLLELLFLSETLFSVVLFCRRRYWYVCWFYKIHCGIYALINLLKMCTVCRVKFVAIWQVANAEVLDTVGHTAEMCAWWVVQCALLIVVRRCTCTGRSVYATSDGRTWLVNDWARSATLSSLPVSSVSWLTHDTIPDAVLVCSQQLTWVDLQHGTNNWKVEKQKS